MIRFHNFILSAALGVCMLGVANVGAAQATSNPSSPADLSGPAANAVQGPDATTQPAPTPAANGAAQSSPSTPDRSQTPGVTSTSGAADTADQQPVGIAGRNATTTSGHGHGGVLALMIVLAFAFFAYVIFGRNRAATTRPNSLR